MLRPATAEDMPIVRGQFAAGVKESSNRLSKLPWAPFKRDFRPALFEELAAAEVFVAAEGPEVVGWIAVTRGKRVDTIHWLTSRHNHRREGVARALVDRVALTPRIVYTHRGVRRSDEWLVPWLQRRGAISVVYAPYKEWKQ